jgi:membrane-bound lytic murein transglycosylase D
LFIGPFLFYIPLVISILFFHKMHISIRVWTFSLVVLISHICVFPQSDTEWKVSPQVVEERIKALDALTPMDLVYNKDVQAYIDVYTIRRRDHLARILGRAELYFPLFEEHLDRLGLPLELKYLAVTESALDPLAKSTSGAIGLWQFLFHAARMVDLQVTSYVDERRDPVKSTEAAARYLKYLYNNFHNWDLALASYNGGIATVNEAIYKSGGQTDFWKIR